MNRLVLCICATLASAAHASVVYVPLYAVLDAYSGVSVIPPGGEDVRFSPPTDCISSGSFDVLGLGSTSLIAHFSGGTDYADRLSEGEFIGPSDRFTGRGIMMHCTCCTTIGDWAVPGTEGYLGLAFIVSGHTYYGWLRVRHHASGAFAALDGAYESSSAVPIVAGAGRPGCETGDFNHDGDSGTDADIEAFFSCLAGQCCLLCGTADFNGDGDSATDADIEAFFRVLAAGSC